MAIGAEVNGKLVHSPVVDDSSLALSHADPVEAIEQCFVVNDLGIS